MAGTWRRGYTGITSNKSIEDPLKGAAIEGRERTETLERLEVSSG